MTPEEAAEKREAIIDALTEKWHDRDCGCGIESCPKAVDARMRAWGVLDLARDAFRKRLAS